MHKIGFIGLGNMGKGMATNLANSNIPLTCYDIDNSVFNDLKDINLKQSNNLRNLIETNEIIITMLPDGPIVNKVWRQMIDYARRNMVFIDCSTIDVETSLKVQKLAFYYHANLTISL